MGVPQRRRPTPRGEATPRKRIPDAPFWRLFGCYCPGTSCSQIRCCCCFDCCDCGASWVVAVTREHAFSVAGPEDHERSRAFSFFIFDVGGVRDERPSCVFPTGWSAFFGSDAATGEDAQVTRCCLRFCRAPGASTRSGADGFFRFRFGEVDRFHFYTFTQRRFEVNHPGRLNLLGAYCRPDVGRPRAGLRRSARQAGGHRIRSPIGSTRRFLLPGAFHARPLVPKVASGALDS